MDPYRPWMTNRRLARFSSGSCSTCLLSFSRGRRLPRFHRRHLSQQRLSDRPLRQPVAAASRAAHSCSLPLRSARPPSPPPSPVHHSCASLEGSLPTCVERLQCAHLPTMGLLAPTRGRPTIHSSMTTARARAHLVQTFGHTRGRYYDSTVSLVCIGMHSTILRGPSLPTRTYKFNNSYLFLLF